MEYITDVFCNYILGITAHFFDHNLALKAVHLNMVDFEETHTSENIATTFTSVCDNWAIDRERVIGVTHDNASNICKAVEMAFTKSKSIRCTAHTLNLIARATMKESSAKFIIDKVKTIAAFFNSSTKAVQSLRDRRKDLGLPELMVIQSCDVRWNSTLQMLERFTKLSDDIGSTLYHLGAGVPQMIDREELTIISDITALLGLVDECSSIVSAEKQVTISQIIPATRGLVSY